MNILEDKINLLYNFIYSDDKFNSKVSKIDINKINLDDIKIIKENNSEEYNDMISSLFTGKFKEIYFDENTNTMVLKRYSDGFNIGLHVTPYKSKNHIDDLSSFNNNDSLFSYLLSYLSLNNKTNHILLPIINIDVGFSQFEDIVSKVSNYDIIKKKLNNNEISDIFSIRVRENFFKSMTLSEYISSNQCDLKKLLFQVIHTLAIIQNEYKHFRHNNLSPDNILVYLKKSTSEYDEYNFNGIKYYIPKNKFIIKIGNFNFSSIPEYYGNSSKIPFGNKNNHYFDLHFFLNSLLDIIDISGCDSNTTEFINKIIPQKYRSNKNNYYMEKNVELFSPAQLIEDEFFSEYTKNKKSDMMMNESKDEFVFGSRRINSKSKKSSKLKRRDTSRKHSQTGGDMTVKNPNPVANNPFVTNEQRKQYMANREQRQIKKPNNIIAEQTVKKNPHYINPMRLKPRKKNTWEHGYDGGVMDKFHVPKGTVQTGDNKDNDSDKYSNAGDFVPPVKPHYDKPKEKSFHKPYDNKFKPKYRDNMTTESNRDTHSETHSDTHSDTRSESSPSRPHSPHGPSRPHSPHGPSRPHSPHGPSRPHSPHGPSRPHSPHGPPRPHSPHGPPRPHSPHGPPRQGGPPRDMHPREKFERNNTYDTSNRPYKAKYETNVTQTPILAEQKVYQPAMPTPGAGGHSHPKNYQPAIC